jgi:hypothetical protein
MAEYKIQIWAQGSAEQVLNGIEIGDGKEIVTIVCHDLQHSQALAATIAAAIEAHGENTVERDY